MRLEVYDTAVCFSVAYYTFHFEAPFFGMLYQKQRLINIIVMAMPENVGVFLKIPKHRITPQDELYPKTLLLSRETEKMNLYML